MPGVKEHPILFSAEMVRAILNMRKVQTRRIVRDQEHAEIFAFDAARGDWEWGVYGDSGAVAHGGFSRCPYGVPGDRLWVRETWYDDTPGEAPESRSRREDEVDGILYRATHDCSGFEAGCPCNPDGDGKRSEWRPSIFMPRWASRITLEVNRVRVERLQDISESDAIDEGVQREAFTARDAFAKLWDSINGDRAPWRSNPWVWAVHFRWVLT